MARQAARLPLPEDESAEAALLAFPKMRRPALLQDDTYVEGKGPQHSLLPINSTPVKHVHRLGSTFSSVPPNNVILTSCDQIAKIEACFVQNVDGNQRSYLIITPVKYAVPFVNNQSCKSDFTEIEDELETLLPKSFRVTRFHPKSSPIIIPITRAHCVVMSTKISPRDTYHFLTICDYAFSHE